MDQTTYVDHGSRTPGAGTDRVAARDGDQLDAARQARLIAELGFRGASFFLHGTDHLAA